MLRNSLLLVAGAIAPLGATGLYVYSDVHSGSNESVAATAGIVHVAGTPDAAAAQSGDATIKGNIKFDGEAPKREAVDMVKDGVCVKANAAPVMKEEMAIVGKDNGLKNVFVYIKKGIEGKFDAPKDAVALDQKNCMYSPHVFGLVAGQKLTVKNSDQTTHNVHSMGKKNKQLNQGQPAGSQELSVENWKTKETSLWIKCDIHSWMSSVCHVVPHPFFAVTDEAGNFEIKNLPAGTYTLEAIHETLGSKELEVKVDAKGSVEAKFPAFGKK
ncbi:MAG: hypothetical protein HY286_14455 [Planctomycetes bacterium]|nr:hypothetical protein [Planctomycetota bacterium]